jgi:hypothetical protein
MKTVFLFSLSFLFQFLFFQTTSWAKGRTLIVPGYPTRYVFTYPAIAGAVCDNQKIGAILSVRMALMNISNVAQTVTVEPTNGFQWSVSQVGCSFVWPVEAAHCIGSSTGKSGLLNSWEPGKLSTVKYVIPANSSADYSIFLVASTKYGLTAECVSTLGAKHNSADFFFSPTLKITVEEDRGAMLASLVPLIDGPVNGYQVCGSSGISFSDYSETCWAKIGEQRTATPLLINGGRPF